MKCQERVPIQEGNEFDACGGTVVLKDSRNNGLCASCAQRRLRALEWLQTEVERLTTNIRKGPPPLGWFLEGVLK